MAFPKLFSPSPITGLHLRAAHQKDAEAHDEGDDDRGRAILNSSKPISGTIVRSSPTMPPANALTRPSSENCRQFSRRPNSMLGE
jgi:hypothetical protein